ncbi:LAFA_0E10704g1_1 [Lachancea sp. 'fantastica']|nr:LAFA_0E10704g1_1 [Lachancea sp. 'fantastica']
MLSWPEITQLVRSGDLQLLLRSPAVTTSYHRYKQALEDRHTTVADVVVHEKLHWTSKMLIQCAQKWPTANLQFQAMLSDPQLFALRTNDFPYDFPDHVHHLVLWSKIQIPLYVSDSREKVAIVETKIQQFLKANLARYNIQDFVWFINYPSLQSVKAVSHIHVLINSGESEKIDHILANGFESIGFEPI